MLRRVAARAIRASSGNADERLDVLALIDELLALDLGDEAPLIDRIKRAPSFDFDQSDQTMPRFG